MTNESPGAFTLYSIVVFPKSWPPSLPESIFSGTVDGIPFNLLSHRDGHLSVTVERGDTPLEVHFQRIKPSRGGGAILCLTRNGDAIGCQIGLHELKQLEISNGEIFEFEPSATIDASTPIHFSQDLLARVSRPEWLFLHTLFDIEQKIKSNDPYQIIRLTGLVRHLIFDGDMLAETVRENYMDVPLMFNVVKRITPLPDVGSEPSFWLYGIFPERENRHPLSRSAFLNATAMYYGAKRVTVYQVLDVVAHVIGGVHYRDPKTDVEDLLLAADTAFRAGNISVLLCSVQEIAKVVLVAMRPIAAAIFGKHSPKH